MDFSPAFWEGLLKIIGVDIVLAGDNAVIIALASRSLPPHLRSRAIWFGAAGAVGMRLVFSFFIIELLAVPYLKIIGALLLLWIGAKMLVPEHDTREIGAKDDGGGVGTVWAAIRTIIIADAVMSLDNVIGIVAASNGDIVLIAIGLAISVPLIIYGSTLILKYLIRYPVLVLAGAGLIGWIAGEIWISDPAVSDWTRALMDSYGHGLEYLSAALGVVVVIGTGKLAALRVKRKRSRAQVVDLATEDK